MKKSNREVLAATIAKTIRSQMQELLVNVGHNNKKYVRKDQIISLNHSNILPVNKRFTDTKK
jgi:hypothetical protein